MSVLIMSSDAEVAYHNVEKFIIHGDPRIIDIGGGRKAKAYDISVICNGKQNKISLFALNFTETESMVEFEFPVDATTEYMTL